MTGTRTFCILQGLFIVIEQYSCKISFVVPLQSYCYLIGAEFVHPYKLRPRLRDSVVNRSLMRMSLLGKKIC